MISSRLFRSDRAVLIVNSLLANAGVERRTLELAQFLKSRGIQVEVCVLRESGKVARLFEETGISVRTIRVYEYIEGEGRYRFFPLAFLRLVAHLGAGRFGLVFCVQPPSYIFGRAACYPPLGRRIVAMERFLIGDRSRRRARCDRWMAGWSKVVCVSTLLRDQLSAATGIPAARIAVIEDGVAVEAPSDPQDALRARLQGRFVFGCVGLLTRRKRQALLIEAFAQLMATKASRRPALVLVGDGEDRDLLRQLVCDLGLEEDVIFTGEQEHPDDFYPLFDTFVFPSVGEGLGNVWAEAMLHGLPVICADVRPMNDYVRHEENGLLAAPDDKAMLCREMVRLMESESLRREMAARGKSFAHEHFQRERQLQKLLDFTLAA